MARKKSRSKGCGEAHSPTAASDTTDLRESFDQCDTDDDGRIQRAEFITLLDNLEAGLSPTEAEIGFRELDTDDDGVIDFGEFLAWWNEP